MLNTNLYKYCQKKKAKVYVLIGGDMTVALFSNWNHPRYLLKTAQKNKAIMIGICSILLTQVKNFLLSSIWEVHLILMWCEKVVILTDELAEV